MCRAGRFVAFLIIACAAASCSPRPDAPRPLIRLVVPGGHPEAAIIAIDGLPESDLAVLRGRTWTPDEWAALLPVSVAMPRGSPNLVAPIAGTYSVTADAIEFRPTRALESGQRYRVALNVAQLPSSSGLTGEALVVVVGMP